MKFRPCIDIHQGKVKQIVGSSLGESMMTNFETNRSAIEFAQIFADFGYQDGHVCILDQEPETKELALEVLNTFPGIWQIGGGVNGKTADFFLKAGASQAIITSALFDGPDILANARALAETIGKKNLVLDLSCEPCDQKYWLMKDGWLTRTDFEVSLKTLKTLSEYCSEFLIHGVSVEGKKAGFDTGLVNLLTKFYDQKTFRINYAGGIGSMKDLESFNQISGGVLDFTIGSGLSVYGGEISLEALKKYSC